MIEHQLIDGRLATVVYFTNGFEPTDRDSADLIKIIYHDGDTEFVVPPRGVMDWNPDQPRDPAGSPTGGQWSSGTSGGDDDEPEGLDIAPLGGWTRGNPSDVSLWGGEATVLGRLLPAIKLVRQQGSHPAGEVFVGKRGDWHADIKLNHGLVGRSSEGPRHWHVKEGYQSESEGDRVSYERGYVDLVTKRYYAGPDVSIDAAELHPPVSKVAALRRELEMANVKPGDIGFGPSDIGVDELNDQLARVKGEYAALREGRAVDLHGMSEDNYLSAVGIIRQVLEDDILAHAHPDMHQRSVYDYTYDKQGVMTGAIEYTLLGRKNEEGYVHWLASTARGSGTKLLKRATEFLKSKGVRMVTLYSLSASTGFYEHFGFHSPKGFGDMEMSLEHMRERLRNAPSDDTSAEQSAASEAAVTAALTEAGVKMLKIDELPDKLREGETKATAPRIFNVDQHAVASGMVAGVRQRQRHCAGRSGRYDQTRRCQFR